MRLYWKLFLAIIASLILTVAITGWISRQWLMENQQIDSRLDSLAEQGETAASIYLSAGTDAYSRWLRQARSSLHFRGVLIDSEGRPVAARHIPPHLAPMVERMMQKQQAVRSVEPPFIAVARPIDTDAGRYYWLAASLLPADLAKQNATRLLLFRLAIALIIIALISWMLSRMIARPVDRLRRSVAAFGKGKLATRSDTALAGRRDELGELARSFDAMAAQLQAMLLSHKQLLRDVSHELRSPLARLQVALELARESAGDAAASELDRIDREAVRLNTLIGEVLTLARFEEGAVAQVEERIQLQQLLDEIVEDARFEAEAQGKGIQLHDLPSWELNGDRTWLGRALDNVIRNAIRHTAAGSQVDVAMHVRGRQAEIRVRDRGPGVPQEALAHLFEPFFRASESRDRESGGYGLGLAIAERAIRMHHGTIAAANHPQGGLEVTITLPA